MGNYIQTLQMWSSYVGTIGYAIVQSQTSGGFLLNFKTLNTFNLPLVKNYFILTMLNRIVIFCYYICI